jgi:hypothetical protein
MRRRSLLPFAQISPKAGDAASVEPLPGSVHAEYGRCGTVTCRCTTGDLHGPYWRRFWREGGRTRSQYIPQARVPVVLAACTRYQQLHQSRRAFRRMLRDFERQADAAIAHYEALLAHRR